MSVLLTLQHVSKRYPTKDGFVEALTDINLTIMEGEVLALLGINGAGKTTLSSILATLHPATSGTILYRDSSIYQELHRYKKALGFCPQKPNLDPALNVQENLVFAGRYYLMPEQEIQARVCEIMATFNLTRYAQFSIDALSGGYKQRLLIARALMHRPRLIILDEPTVGLDPDVRRQIWDIIKQLRAQGVTVILTTHYLDEAEVLADRVCMLSKGQILFIDNAANLKQSYKKENLEEVFLHLLKEEAA